MFCCCCCSYFKKNRATILPQYVERDSSNHENYLSYGGFSNVYTVYNPRTKKTYVEKRVALRYKSLVLEEIAALKKLEGKVTPQFFFNYEINDKIIIAMEIISGNELFKYSTTHDIPKKEAISIIFQLINGLIFLKRKRLVHLDIKLENIIINYETKKITIIDLGSAHVLPKKMKRLTRSVGTLTYAAPEIYLSFYHQSSDIFSVGCVYWVLRTKYLPFLIKHKRTAWHDVPDIFPPRYNEEHWKNLDDDEHEFLQLTLVKNCKFRPIHDDLLILPLFRIL